MDLKINPNERPSRMLARLEAPNSDGGNKITKEEAEQAQLLHRYWADKNFSRLKMLPEYHVLGEIRALKKIQKLPHQEKSGSSSNPIMAGLFINAVAAAAILAVLVASGKIVWEALEGEVGVGRIYQLIDRLEARLDELEAKKQKGEIAEEAYRKARRKILNEAFHAK